MNTKGIKFLAVLAVMVMAFAAIVALAPADNDVDAVNIYAFDKAQIDPAKIGEDYTGDITEFYISDDATVKFYDNADIEGVMIYVQNGKELELDVRENLGYSITILSVTGDLQGVTTSTVDTEPGDKVGKIIIKETEVTFNGVVGQSVVYTAMMPYAVDTHTTSASGKTYIVTQVDTHNSTGLIQEYAFLSSDAEFDDVTIKSLVTIAPGQYIDVTGTVTGGFSSYGIMVTDADSEQNSVETRYYAVGASAESFEMDNNDDVVDIKYGSITVNNGLASVKATSVSDVTLTRAADDVIKIATPEYGMSGSMAVSGEVYFEDAVIGGYGVVSVAANTTTTGTVTVNGQLNLRNDAGKIEDLTVKGEGLVSALSEKLWTYEGVKPYLKFKGTELNDLKDFKGLVDVSAITKSADVHDSFSTALIERNQTFVVVADTVVTTSLDVKGVLIINEGVTLTITKTNKIGAAVSTVGQYAQIINNGEILIKTTVADTGREAGLQIHGGLFENNGRILANSDASANSPATEETPATETITLGVDFVNMPTEAQVYSVGGPGFINYGTITANKNDRVALQDDKFYNAGTMSINGIFAGGEFTNAGVFTFNNAEIVGDLTVNMELGATASLNAAKLGDGKSVKINDDAGSAITVKATGDVNVRGITVTDTGKKNMPLDLSGSIGINKSGTSSGKATLTVSKGITVNETATIGEGYDLNLKAAKITVPGTLTVLKDDKATDTVAGLVLTVTGAVYDVGNRLSECDKFVAAKFTIPTTGTVYTTLEDAVPAAVEADVNIIEVGHNGTTYPTVKSDLVIPEGMFVSGEGIVIGDSKKTPTVMVEESAGFIFQSIKIVEGMIVAENVNDVSEDVITADVKKVDSTTYSGVFMSLRVALALATEGDVIELSQDFENISNDLTIPAGVTVDATAADEHYGFYVIDSNLYIDGMLIIDDFRFYATTDDTKGIYVNGTIMNYNTDGKGITKSWYTPVGVSYKLTLEDETGDEHTWYVLTNLDNLQESIYIADDSKVNVEGDVVLDDITLHGSEEQPAEVTFKGDVTAGTITIDNVSLVFTDGKQVTATVADALGSITITGAYAKDKLTIYSKEEAGVYMTGSVTDDKTGTYSIRFDGLTGMNGSSKTVIGWGNNLEGKDPAILFNGTTLSTGKKVTIGNTENDDVADGMVTITGSLIADNGNKLIMNTDVQILGGLFALERTEEAVAGTVEIGGNVFVGTLMSDVYNSELAKAAYEKNMPKKELVESVDYGESWMAAAAASMSGKISVDVANDKFITVLAGSEIDPAIVEDLKSMDVIIEDAVWITVYGTEDYSLDGLLAPIVNAKVDTIVNADGDVIAYFDVEYKVIYGCGEYALDEYGTVYISLDYNAFNVVIKTDGSVKAVYIDGILMYTGENRNTFTLDKIATGTHKVTVEAATGYDADKCVLYTEMGTILPGMAFTFTEYDCEYDAETDSFTVIYNINGTEIQPEPVPPTPEEESQWTVTTILLVILVVLIAIMAVIVALRLNRS